MTRVGIVGTGARFALLTVLLIGCDDSPAEPDVVLIAPETAVVLGQVLEDDFVELLVTSLPRSAVPAVAAAYDRLLDLVPGRHMDAITVALEDARTEIASALATTSDFDRRLVLSALDLTLAEAQRLTKAPSTPTATVGP